MTTAMAGTGDRLAALVVARVHGARSGISLDDLVKPLVRFAPAELTEVAWRGLVSEAVSALRARSILGDDHRARDAGELARRIGRVTARSWPELADRVLPALALGIAADDTKARAKLDSRDAWAAAIVGRALGLWRDGSPPSLPAMCDALVWRELGLPGKPKRCPPEVRALFVQRRLGSDAGPPERLVRVLAAREAGAPRPELRALRDALVRGWLAGRAPGELAAAAGSPGTGGARGSDTMADVPGADEPEPPTASEVLRAASAVVDGRFGDRKVFVSAVWEQLRRDPRWSDLALPALKARLVAAHRAGELTLARADLVAAMDPDLVAASEIEADGASFHFVVVEPIADERGPEEEPA